MLCLYRPIFSCPTLSLLILRLVPTNSRHYSNFKLRSKSRIFGFIIADLSYSSDPIEAKNEGAMAHHATRPAAPQAGVLIPTEQADTPATPQTVSVANRSLNDRKITTACLACKKSKKRVSNGFECLVTCRDIDRMYSAVRTNHAQVVSGSEYPVSPTNVLTEGGK